MSARLVGDEDASEDGDTPSPVDMQEACAGALVLGKDVVGYNAAAHEQQNRRADYLREEDRSERHSHLFPTSIRMSLVARGTSPSRRPKALAPSLCRIASLMMQ